MCYLETQLAVGAGHEARGELGVRRDPEDRGVLQTGAYKAERSWQYHTAAQLK